MFALVCLALAPLSSPPFNVTFTPSFRGAPCTAFGGWESFTQPFSFANAPDDPNSTTTLAAVSQLVPGAIITGAGNIDHLSLPPQYRVSDAVPADLQEVVLQVSILLNQVNWSNARLRYVDGNGVLQSIAPTTSQYLVFQMGHEERLLTWDLSGNADTILSYQIDVPATNSFTTLDAVKLDARWHCNACPAPVSYCTAGTTTNGCNASLSASGTPSVAASTGFVLQVANVEGQKQGIVFYGTSGRAATHWGSGGTSFLCVKAPTQRMSAANSGGNVGQCDGALSIDWLAFVASHPSALGVPFSAGNVVQAQAWFRDPPATKTTNLSGGLEFTLCP